MPIYYDQFYEKTNKVSYEWKIVNSLDREYSDGKLESPKLSFSGTKFSIKLYPNGNTKDNVGWVSLFLNKEFSQTDQRVKFTIELRRHDGSILVSRHFNHLFPRQNTAFGDDRLIERLQLTSAENVSRPDGTLTVFCELCEADEPSAEAETQTSLVDSFETLSNDFKKFYLSGCQTDVVINVKGKKFLAHRSILSAQSSFFRSMFEVDMKERESDDVNITDCDPESFGSFLLFLYSGRFEVASSDSALALHATAMKYKVQDLEKKCNEYLGRELCVDNFCDVLRLASSLHGEQELLDHAYGFFTFCSSKILRTLKYKTLSEDKPNVAEDLFLTVADVLEYSGEVLHRKREHCDHFYETARKASYEWKIENFFGRASCNNVMLLHSPKFLISHIPFFIEVCPNGNNEGNTESVSIFLNKETSLTKLRVKATLGLKHDESSILESHDMNYLFPAESQRFGCPNLIEMSKFTSAEKDVSEPGGIVTVFCVVHEASIPAVEDDDSEVNDNDKVEFDVPEEKNYCDEYDLPPVDPSLIQHFKETTQAIFGIVSEEENNDSVAEDDKHKVKAETQTSPLMDNFEMLSKNFAKIYASGYQTDVVMDVRGKKFSAHRSILSARSSVFRAMFDRDMKERKIGEVSIDDCDPKSFGSFLLYLYSGRLDVVSSDNALALYTTADKYNVQELKKECCEFLNRDLNVRSVCDVLSLAALHEEQELLKNATDCFVNNAAYILRTLDWYNLRAKNPNLAHYLFIKVADTLNNTALITVS